ncbi:nuclear transport factor 2 family protein [Elongatibacter sediminis]|uniref:Nuclear transport factor 2 family protein n=1 Tax=Elongatibacter sediminis TaxID=3119006 RepID=A0AAW9RHM2_9GAMM
MQSKMDVIRELMKATEAQDDEAFLSFLTDDIEYHYHVGSRPLNGKDWVRKFMSKYREIAADVKWRIDRHAESGDHLFVEGYEEYRDTRTGDMIAHPYMGIFEFRDGKIAAWRDYFEMNQKKAD